MEWKLANIIPIHKQGNKNHVENYRPISLLSIVSKTLERCILNHISQHIQSNIHSANLVSLTVDPVQHNCYQF